MGYPSEERSSSSLSVSSSGRRPLSSSSGFVLVVVAMMALVVLCRFVVEELKIFLLTMEKPEAAVELSKTRFKCRSMLLMSP